MLPQVIVSFSGSVTVLSGMGQGLSAKLLLTLAEDRALQEDPAQHRSKGPDKRG